MGSERKRSAGKYVIASLVVASALVGGAAVASVSGDDGKGQERRTDGLPQKTDTIKRQDLSSRTQVDGTLGYSKERKLNGGAQGTVTWLPDTGAVIKRNEALYEVDGNKIWLLYGERPMYRKLKAGDKGPDVRQLKQNLRDLGFGAALTMDDEFTSGTAEALKRWQKSHGLKQTGQTGPEQIAFTSSSLRVKKKEAAAGDQTGPGRPVLTATGAEREVQIKLDVADAALAEPGTSVEITLPGGDKAKGKVASVDRSASSDQKDQGGGGQDQSAKVTARVTFTDPSQAKGIDQAPVTVELKGETHQKVLTVPVNALLALPAGGFGVQVVEGGKAREIPVKLGLFGQGRVEISGSGLKEGMKVGVPHT
ncbi:peptidoglycan-binding protein [Streptomyces yunnanensis]|uniref:Multidrug efflux pump subunit AcrA (Membrane-fusion protein) n=1 Tax=Streptomyces yunnanensis TaxID=156453 RepID=A0A9X8N303_9ACTN|nr:peptidoglycan-binding protein [Streptomyces yunnanensis]SHM79950.1 Multidrug efflux pump subunit AcrA (membrane-fusion protein) [Streptomyces yunnanensis]